MYTFFWQEIILKFMRIKTLVKCFTGENHSFIQTFFFIKFLNLWCTYKRIKSVNIWFLKSLGIKRVRPWRGDRECFLLLSITFIFARKNRIRGNEVRAAGRYFLTQAISFWEFCSLFSCQMLKFCCKLIPSFSLVKILWDLNQLFNFSSIIFLSFQYLI